MKLTNRLSFIVLIMLILNACSGINLKKENTDVKAEQESTGQVNAEGVLEPIEIPFVAIAKPEAQKVSVPSSAKQEFAQAKEAMQNQKWQEAQGLLLLMTETYPKLAGIYTNLGIVYTQLEQFDDAEKAYRFAITTNKQNFDAYTNLGVLLREQGKFTEAEAVYKDALAVWPHHRASVLNLGVLYDMYLGDLAAALEHYELAQNLSESEDRKLKGWIIDLQRRAARK